MDRLPVAGRFCTLNKIVLSSVGCASRSLPYGFLENIEGFRHHKLTAACHLPPRFDSPANRV